MSKDDITKSSDEASESQKNASSKKKRKPNFIIAGLLLLVVVGILFTPPTNPDAAPLGIGQRILFALMPGIAALVYIIPAFSKGATMDENESSNRKVMYWAIGIVLFLVFMWNFLSTILQAS